MNSHASRTRLNFVRTRKLSVNARGMCQHMKSSACACCTCTVSEQTRMCVNEALETCRLLKGATSRYFESFLRRTKLRLNCWETEKQRFAKAEKHQRGNSKAKRNKDS